MGFYINERMTGIQIVTAGSELFIIQNPPENPDFIKETQETLKKYQSGELKDMSVDEFIKGLRE